MKSIKWLALIRFNTIRVLVISFLLVAFGTACTEDAIDLSSSNGSGGGGGNKAPKASKSANSNSESSYGDYAITVTKDVNTWTYVITKTCDTKDLSHFILDLENCPGNQTLNFSSILSATVNGVPAVLSTSEGNTGCEVASVTSNFVKVDDLGSATSYTIVFTLNGEYGNVLKTTAWLKAGTSCHAYEVNGPCCAFF